MKLLLLCLLLQPTILFAEKKMKTKDMSILGKIDESNFKEPEARVVEDKPKKVESKMTLTCKEEDGREFKQGEVGYDTCLNGLRNRSELSKRNSGVYETNKKDQSGAGVSFKIGD